MSQSVQLPSLLLHFILYAATPLSVVHLCSMPFGSFLWIFSVFCSRALRSRLINSTRPHLFRRFFLRSILKELKSGKENFELGKCLFFTFILFLVQLLQSVFVGRYLYIIPVCPSSLSPHLKRSFDAGSVCPAALFTSRVPSRP